MVRTIGGWLAITLLPVLLGTSAWGASISGTVSNATGKSGRIYLSLNYLNGGSYNLGTSISSAGAFTINGVQSNTRCTVQAFVDTQGTGVQHANDPAGVSAEVTTGSGNVSVGSFAVTAPSASAPQAPQLLVYPGNGGNFVMWDGARNAHDLPIADKYTVAWSSSAAGTPVAGQQEMVANGDMDLFAHQGGTASMYYRVTATNGAGSASSAWVKGSAPAGTGSVSGKIFFPGLTPTGPLFVALANENSDPPRIHIVAVANPVSGATYSASNVPSGTYSIYPILDQNNNGVIDTGDLSLPDGSGFNAQVTVAGSAVTAPDVTLENVDASALLTTSHGRHQWDDWYNLEFSVQSMKKQVVKAQLVSGPQLPGPMDLALDQNQFQSWLNIGNSRPAVGDSYQIKVTYADGSTATVNKAVTGVLDAFATPITPVGVIPFDATPTFSWSQPSPAPAQYRYNLWVSEVNGQDGIWDAWGLPPERTSIVYGSQGEVGQPELTDGTSYRWSLSVTDQNGNRAQSEASFIPTNSPGSFPPSVTSFTPQSGKAGSSVVLYGNNFRSAAAENVVKFNGASAVVTAASLNSLTVTVPAAVTSGPISVTTAGGTASSGMNFTMRYTLTTSVTGSNGGLGTVTSAPGGISCRTSGCSADFDQGSQLQLNATPDGGSAFSGWSGACTGSGPCSFALNENKTVGASFQKQLYLKNGDNYYSLLQEAFDAAADGDTILARGLSFTDASLLFNKPALQVRLKGGYDGSFLGNSGFTTLDGRLDLRGGLLRVERVKIR